MKAPGLALVMIAFLALAVPAPAATVTLSNGDRITGEVVRVEEGKLTLLSEHLGEVRIPLAAMATVTAEKPVTAILASGDLVTGRLESAGEGKARIVSDSGAFDLELTDIRRLRPAPELPAGVDAFEAARALFTEPEKSPWSGTLQAGGNYSSGNTHRKGYYVTFGAVRDTEDDRFEIKAKTTYEEQNGARTTNEQALSFREDLKFDPWTFFGLLSFERDEFENLDLRAILSPGLGRVLADGDDFKVRVELGPSLSLEDFKDQDAEWDLEARFGLFAELAVFDQAKLTEEFQFFPVFGSGGEYRWTSETAFTQPLSKVLFFKLSVLNEYNSDVLKGVKRHDLKVLAGIVFHF